MADAVPRREVVQLMGGGGGAVPLKMLRRVLAKVTMRLDRFRQGSSARIVASMRENFKMPPPAGDAAAFLTLPLSCSDLPRWANRWTFLVDSSRASVRRAVRAVFTGEKDGRGEFVSPVLAIMRRFLLSRDVAREPFLKVCMFTTSALYLILI